MNRWPGRIAVLRRVPRCGRAGVAQQLVVVLVGGGDEHLAGRGGRGQRGDHVVGFGVLDLDPGDAVHRQAGLDVRQGKDRPQRLGGRGPVAL
jgi:hypothetical protein